MTRANLPLYRTVRNAEAPPGYEIVLAEMPHTEFYGFRSDESKAVYQAYRTLSDVRQAAWAHYRARQTTEQ